MPTVVSSNQGEDDRSVRSLLNSYAGRVPVVLVADDKYQLFPWDLGKYTYAVLGFYWIVAAWGTSFPSLSFTL